MTNLELARILYKEKGAPMIREKFPDYEARIAVGFAGEGSDCFGFDDAVSRDHDFGPGFCLWLTEGDHERIGDELNREYAVIIKEACAQDPSIAPSGYDPRLALRRGAKSIKAWYQDILHVRIEEDGDPLRYMGWLSVDEVLLACAVNGEVFRDDLGLFSGIRSKLQDYYPEAVWKRRLIHEMREFSQYAQSNYARCMARQDATTAAFCKARAAESAYRLMFLLNRRFAPYYKWLRKDACSLPRLSGVRTEVDRVMALPNQTEAWKYYRYDATRLNTEDAVEIGFERIAALFAKELAAQGLIGAQDGRITFLDHLAGKIAAQEAVKSAEKTKGTVQGREKLIAEVVRHEWRQFDKVQNEGGRAGCQDDWKTFEIMRTAQYRAWDDELLERYLKDLKDAEENGWNLITEKYARMMQSTDPAAYRQLEDRLPKRSPERLARQEEVIKIHVAWNEEMASCFPKYSGGGRPIHTSEDQPWETSSETYLRGELSTYSDETFRLYREMVLRRYAAGENLVERIATTQVKQYGYQSLEEVEEHLTNR